MPIVTASDVSKLVDALAAEQDKCTRLVKERAALIEALKPLVRHWETCTIEVDDSGEKAYDLLHEMGELEEK